MATIRKRSGKYHAQIRKTGYQTLTKTFSSLTTAKRWASATEADMERNLHIVIPDTHSSEENFWSDMKRMYLPSTRVIR